MLAHVHEWWCIEVHRVILLIAWVMLRYDELMQCIVCDLLYEAHYADVFCYYRLCKPCLNDKFCFWMQFLKTLVMLMWNCASYDDCALFYWQSVKFVAFFSAFWWRWANCDTFYNSMQLVWLMVWKNDGDIPVFPKNALVIGNWYKWYWRITWKCKD